MARFIYARNLTNVFLQILREKEVDLPLLQGAREMAHLDIRGLSARDTVISHKRSIDEIAAICARGATYCEIEVIYPKGLSRQQENHIRSCLIYRKAADRLRIREILEIADQIDIQIVPYVVYRDQLEDDLENGSRRRKRGRKSGITGRDQAPPKNGENGTKNPGNSPGPETPFQEALKNFETDKPVPETETEIMPEEGTDVITGDGSGEDILPADNTEKEAPEILPEDIPDVEDDGVTEAGPEKDPDISTAEIQIRDNDAAEADIATNTQEISDADLPDAEVSKTD